MVLKTARQMKALTIAVVAVLLMGASVLIGPGVASAASGCAPVHFVGVRGSGEASGLGATVSAVYAGLDGRTAKRVTTHALEYPATSIPIGNAAATIRQFWGSINSGSDRLSTHVTAQIRKCPSQRIVLAGYSQGAIVIHKALERLPAAAKRNIVGVALLGDPRFSPSFVGNVGTFDATREGVSRYFLEPFIGRTFVPAAYAPVTRSYCLAGDVICNYSLANLHQCVLAVTRATCAHSRYDESGTADQAGQYLASKL